MTGQDKFHENKKTAARALMAIIACGSICAWAMPWTAHAATLSASSAVQATYEGDTMTVAYTIDTNADGGQSPVNVVDASIGYDAALLSVDGVHTGGSAFVFWPTPAVVVSPGVIHAIGAIPVGIRGNAVPFLSVTYRARSAGQASTGIIGGTAYVADGTGAASALSGSGLAFAVLPAQSKRDAISSSTNPDQSRWYQGRTVRIDFPVKDGESYSYSFSSNEDIVPGQEAHQTAGSVRYDNVPDGTYYFRLASKVPGGMWQESGVFVVHIDGTVPQFSAAAVQDVSDAGVHGLLSFAAIDKASGIARYRARAGYFGWPHDAQPASVISRPIVGSIVYLTAIDAAGNTTTVAVPYRAYMPLWLLILMLAIALAALLFASRVRYNKNVIRFQKTCRSYAMHFFKKQPRASRSSRSSR